jgi:hypothetical protein
VILVLKKVLFNGTTFESSVYFLERTFNKEVKDRLLRAFSLSLLGKGSYPVLKKPKDAILYQKEWGKIGPIAYFELGMLYCLGTEGVKPNEKIREVLKYHSSKALKTV